MVPTAISATDPSIAAPTTPASSKGGDAAAFGDALGAAIADGGQGTAGAKTPPATGATAQEPAAADPSTAALVALLGRMAAGGAKAEAAWTTPPPVDGGADTAPSVDAKGAVSVLAGATAAAPPDSDDAEPAAEVAGQNVPVDPALLALVASQSGAPAAASATIAAPAAVVTAEAQAEALGPAARRASAGPSTTATSAAADSSGTDAGSAEDTTTRAASSGPRHAAPRIEVAAGQVDAASQQPAAQPTLPSGAAVPPPVVLTGGERRSTPQDAAVVTTLQPVTAPAVGAAQATAPATAPAAPTAPTGQPTLAQQVHEPIVALRHAPEGDHVVVVRVTPEHLGTVTVHATVHHGDLSVQLFASSSDARDQLKGMLTDLRRDLGTGGAGTATTLSLGTGDAPQQDPGRQTAAWAGSDTPSGRSAWTDLRGPASRAAATPAEQPVTDLRLRTPGSALLDVLA